MAKRSREEQDAIEESLEAGDLSGVPGMVPDYDAEDWRVYGDPDYDPYECYWWKHKRKYGRCPQAISKQRLPF